MVPMTAEERLVHQAPAPLALVDGTSMTVRSASRSFAEAVGRSPETLEGRGLAEIAGLLFSERVRRAAGELEAGAAAERAFEVRLPRSSSLTRAAVSILEPGLILLSLSAAVPGERTLLNALPDPVLLIDRDGAILESWGRGPGSLGGRDLSVQEALSPEKATGFLDAIARALESSTSHSFEFPITTREGLRRFETRISPCGPDRVLCVMRDVGSSNRRLEEHDALAAVVALTDDVIYSMNLDGVILSWNHAAERVYGYPAEEILTRPFTMIVPPERAGEAASLLAAVRKGERIRNLETIRRHKNGRRIDVSLSVSPLRDDGGAVVGAAVVARDVTELNLLHRALMEATERERRRFGQDLHEGIGQDLTGVVLACRALEIKMGARSRESAAELRRIGELLTKTIGRTRTLARGLYPVGLDGEALPEFLRELTRMVEETFWVRCDVEWEAGARVPGETEARSLYWIVQEAVMNAVRHGDPKRIRVRGWRDLLGVCVSVRDDGKSLGTEVKPGGMGLLVMRSRARAIGAGLTIMNHPDGGVLVECRIPAEGL
jgi:two-component system, LuxR family, sensor kinase FixL